MDLTISTAELRSALHRMQGVIQSKGSMPILGCVLLEAAITPAGGRLTIKATDLELGSTSGHAAEIKKEGSAAINARALFDVAKVLPEAHCRLKLATNNRLEITSGASSFRIAGQSAEDFPVLGLKEPGVAVQVSGLLGEALESVAYAMSSDETRYNLNGVYLDPRDGDLVLVATDGHRMAKRVLADVQVPGLDQGVIVGGAGVRHLMKLLGEEGTGELAVENNCLIYRRPGLLFSARLIDGQFPDYTQVVPTDFKGTVFVKRSEATAAVHRMMLLMDKGRSVTMTLEAGKLNLSARNPDMGDCSDVVGVDYTGPSITIALNGAYVLDMLGSMKSDSVSLNFGDEVSPVVVKGSDQDSVAVLMPMRA